MTMIIITYGNDDQSGRWQGYHHDDQQWMMDVVESLVQGVLGCLWDLSSRCTELTSSYKTSCHQHCLRFDLNYLQMLCSDSASSWNWLNPEPVLLFTFIGYQLLGVGYIVYQISDVRYKI